MVIVRRDHARAAATRCFSELPQANPSILTFGFPPKEEPQVGDPLSTLLAGFPEGEFLREAAEDCLTN